MITNASVYRGSEFDSPREHVLGEHVDMCHQVMGRAAPQGLPRPAWAGHLFGVALLKQWGTYQYAPLGLVR